MSEFFSVLDIFRPFGNGSAFLPFWNYESEAFQILESVTLYRIPTDLILVEFEPDTGAISREISVKK